MSSSATELQTKKAVQGKTEKKIAVLGCGKMGTILLQGFLKQGLITVGYFWYWMALMPVLFWLLTLALPPQL